MGLEFIRKIEKLKTVEDIDKELEDDSNEEISFLKMSNENLQSVLKVHESKKQEHEELLGEKCDEIYKLKKEIILL